MNATRIGQMVATALLSAFIIYQVKRHTKGILDDD